LVNRFNFIIFYKERITTAVAYIEATMAWRRRASID
jgi:hypothetical protein